MANLVVSEESLIPILRVSDANPTPLSGVEEAGSGPVDLFELSDSSAKEEGGEKLDERIPGDNPQGTEEGVVDEVENPPGSTTDEAGGASDQLEAQVTEEDLDQLLCLSPLHLPSTFLNEKVLAAIDLYGSNPGLIDAGTATSLQTPTSSQGDHATKRSNEPTERELGESSVQEHEVISRVERSEDETAPLVLDPAPSMANLVVSEESLIPILGVSDANPTPLLGVEEAGSGPVDLLELSDSSAEEEGGEKSDERIPGDSPQGTEEGVVDEVENPPTSTMDEAGGASDQLEARVAEEDLDCVEN
ncbi:hypothetical protein F2Q69_00058545 [Brassica cretica]|uniref:Uncharacterized protein n=1 Tax=Brassica cretica TaxID=69181 RepID=A0A8S9RQP1_BRACR|nr:hypothetical protein F2Q69_00058545 [Brassica cretica]